LDQVPAAATQVQIRSNYAKWKPMFAPALTILLSSFLLFLVQPIVAKQILPWFGGSAGVWTICLVFFQLVLLLGYTYAHWLSRRLVGSRQFALHVFLLLVSCLTLPIIPASHWRPVHGAEPALRILGLLVATIGLPYFMLASTAPLLQRWLSGAAKSPTQEHSIYRLFALSNLGSLVGLLSYPFAIEPFANVHLQAWVWSCAYGVFVSCFISYALKRRRLPDLRSSRTAGETVAQAPPSSLLYAYWIGCAALGSALLLSITNQITQNVASIPFLWIIPLSVYLLSFVLCFEASYKITAAAIAEFKDSTTVLCGIRSTVSHRASSSELRPCPSLPSRIAVGLRQFHSSIVVEALGEVPTTVTFRRRMALTASSRDSGPI